MLLVVLLMISLGPPELRGWDDLSDNRSLEPAGTFEFLLWSGGNPLLTRSVVKDDPTVICPDIRPLPVSLCRIVDRAEGGEQFPVGDHIRIVPEPYCLCVPRPHGTDLFVPGDFSWFLLHIPLLWI